MSYHTCIECGRYGRDDLYHRFRGIFIGSIAELKVIRNIADVLNGLMTLPNIITVLLLSKMIAAETRKYAGRHIDDKDGSEIPVIHNSKKGVLF